MTSARGGHLDNGLTVSYYSSTRNPAAATPGGLRPPLEADARVVDGPIRYLGFEDPERFRVGLRVAYEEKYRN